MYFASLIIFIICSISDFLDGYLARKFNKESSLGKLLDPIADKILLCSMILSIVLITNDYFIGLMGTLILIREFWVSGLREFTAANNIQEPQMCLTLQKLRQHFSFLLLALIYFLF